MPKEEDKGSENGPTAGQAYKLCTATDLANAASSTASSSNPLRPNVKIHADPNVCRTNAKLHADTNGGKRTGEKSDEASANANGHSIPDLLCHEAIEGCCEGDHYECDKHSHPCTAPTESPCDCCRHGHTLSSLMRQDDCRTCLRQMGGIYVSPKYGFMRQKMLKTLNRRQHEDIEGDRHVGCRRASTPLPQVQVQDLDVDELVKIIEGTHVSSDPRKSAKKARQKEKKIQQKLEEDRLKEEEERLQREEELRLQREEEMRLEEERRHAEEQKRLARKTKKKNSKKKKAAAASGADADEAQSLLNNVIPAHIHPNATVTLTLNAGAKTGLGNVLMEHGTTQNVDTPISVPDSESSKPVMVTIRRCPTQDNYVTITGPDKNGDDKMLYYLVDGQCFSVNQSESSSCSGMLIDKPVLSGEVTPNEKKKKKKKNKNCGAIQTEQKPITITSAEAFGIVRNQATELSHTSIYSPYRETMDDKVDIDSLKLPPGITLTKIYTEDIEGSTNGLPIPAFVPNKGNPVNENQTVETFRNGKSLSQMTTPEIEYCDIIDLDGKYISHFSHEDDFFGPVETGEFEEVVSNKTRRKRNKAAKSQGGEDPDSVKSSPSRAPYTQRYTPPVAEKPLENGKKRDNTTGVASKTVKTNKSARGNSGGSNNGNKNAITYEKKYSPARRDQVPRGNDNNYYRTANSVKVMPRLSRAQNVDYSLSNVVSSKENNDPGVFKPSVTIQAHNSTGHSVNSSKEINENNYFNCNQPTILKRPNVYNPADMHYDNFSKSRNSAVVGKKSEEHCSSIIPNVSHSDQDFIDVKQWVDQRSVNKTSELGPFTVHADAEVEKSWNPWNPWQDQRTATSSGISPTRFGGETVIVEDEKLRENDLPNKTLSFQDIIGRRSAAAKGPIQRPIPTTSAEGMMNSEPMYSIIRHPTSESFNVSRNKFYGNNSNNTMNGYNMHQVMTQQNSTINPGTQQQGAVSRPCVDNRFNSVTLNDCAGNHPSSYYDSKTIPISYNNSNAPNGDSLENTQPINWMPLSAYKQPVAQLQGHFSIGPPLTNKTQFLPCLVNTAPVLGGKDQHQWQHQDFSGNTSPMPDPDIVCITQQQIYDRTMMNNGPNKTGLWTSSQPNLQTNQDFYRTYQETNLNIPNNIDWNEMKRLHRQIQEPATNFGNLSTLAGNWENGSIHHSDYTSGAHP